MLTAGSSWHAAGGVHALNADPNMAALQAYTIDLLARIEQESGQCDAATFADTSLASSVTSTSGCASTRPIRDRERPLEAWAI